MRPERKYLLLRVLDRTMGLGYLVIIAMVSFQKITLDNFWAIPLPLPYIIFKLFFPQPEENKWYTILTIILVHTLFLVKYGIH